MKSHLYIGLLLLLSVAVTGCESQDIARDQEGGLYVGSVEQATEVMRGVTLGSRKLVLKGANGTIALTAGDTADAALKFGLVARGATVADASGLLSSIAIEEVGDDVSYRFSVRSPSPERSLFNVQGTLPGTVPMKIDLENGPIRLSGLGGGVEISQQNGSVELLDASGPINIQTRNGDIAVHMTKMAGVGTGSAMRLVTSNGDINISFPSKASVRVDARTSAGRIYTKDIQFDEESYYPGAAGARFVGRTAEGSSLVELRTENGSISLNGRAPTPDAVPPAPDAPAPPAAPDSIDVPPSPPAPDAPPPAADSTDTNALTLFHRS